MKLEPDKSRDNTDARINVMGAWIEKVWAEAIKHLDKQGLKGFTLPEIAYGMWHEGFGTKWNIKMGIRPVLVKFINESC